MACAGCGGVGCKKIASSSIFIVPAGIFVREAHGVHGSLSLWQKGERRRETTWGGGQRGEMELATGLRRGPPRSAARPAKKCCERARGLCAPASRRINCDNEMYARISRAARGCARGGARGSITISYSFRSQPALPALLERP